MKLKILILLFIGVACTGFSQSDNQTIPIELPNLSPQSPNAFQFTKYGEVNVNESTGVISPSIPLYSYKAGAIEIPITLNYSGNAVKVAQSPTWVGINWNLTPGGVITRQVRDQADETTNDRRFYSRQEINALDGYGEIILDPTVPEGHHSWFGIPGTEWYNTMEAIGNSTNRVDSEADVFNYNFLGYSGSFYLDENLEPHLLNYNKELKIEFIPDPTASSYTSKSTIYITTPQGDKYFFGGQNASESSRNITNFGAGSTVGIHYAQNAFYLYKVEPYKGGQIDFTYTQVNNGGLYHGYVIDKHESLSKGKLVANHCTLPYKYSGLRDITEDIQSRIVLTKISSDLNASTIEFSSSLLDDRMRKLNTVFVKNEDGGIFKKFAFDYSTNTAIERYESDAKFFLTEVNFHDKNEKKIYDYNLEYNNPDELPSKWSMAKDENGYFNDETSNRTLLPKDDRFSGTIYPLANRETNTSTLEYGSLRKIEYPTGGHTTFEYEVPIKGFETVIDSSHVLTVRANHIDPYGGLEPLPNIYTSSLYYSEGGNLGAGENVVVDLKVTNIGSNHQGNYSIEILAVTSLGLESITTPTILTVPANPQNTTRTYNYSFNYRIPLIGDVFSFKLVLNDLSPTNTQNDIIATAKFHFNTENTTPIYHPSLRIKKIKTFDGSSRLPIVKRFYYNGLHSLNEENSVILAGFNHVHTTAYIDGCGPALITPQPYYNLSTSTLNNTYMDDSRKIIYPVVSVSYGGDDFENGGKQTVFRVNPGPPNDLYISSDQNNGELLEVFAPLGAVLSNDNGKVLNEKLVTYNASERTFRVLKETSYVHSSLNTNVHTMNNIKAGTVFTSNKPIKDIRKYNYAFYQLISKKNILTTKITKDYVENSIQPIVTTESYAYGTYVDRPSEIVITDSKGTNKKIKHYYPDDVLDTTSLGHDALSSVEFNAVDKLKKDNLHRLDQVQSETYIYEGSRSDLLTTTRSLFIDDASIVVLPEIVQTSKGSMPLEDRVQYDYYFNGNIREVSKADGTHIVYIWGYNQTQPIAKIENATYAQVSSRVANLQTLSNADDDRTVDILNSNGTITKVGKEGDLREALRNLRINFKNSLVTTYTYDPLIGVTSVTDPRGNTVYYEYDPFNRLKHVKDKDGNILSENEYNYKNQ